MLTSLRGEACPAYLILSNALLQLQVVFYFPHAALGASLPVVSLRCCPTFLFTRPSTRYALLGFVQTGARTKQPSGTADDIHDSGLAFLTLWKRVLHSHLSSECKQLDHSNSRAL